MNSSGFDRALPSSCHLAEDRAKKYALELGERNAAMKADLDLARELQQAVLPVGPAGQPVVRGGDAGPERSLRFEYRYLPSAALGGDFLDTFPVSPTTAGVFLCDAVGHGARAAMLTALVKGMLEQLRSLAADPGGLMTELNKTLLKVLESQDHTIFLTAMYLVVDVENMVLSFSIAGHHSPLLRKSGGRFEVLSR